MPDRQEPRACDGQLPVEVRLPPLIPYCCAADVERNPVARFQLEGRLRKPAVEADARKPLTGVLILLAQVRSQGAPERRRLSLERLALQRPLIERARSGQVGANATTRLYIAAM